MGEENAGGGDNGFAFEVLVFAFLLIQVCDFLPFISQVRHTSMSLYA